MTTHPAPAPVAAAIARCVAAYNSTSPPRYRVVPLEDGTAALQARNPLGVWLTLALGEEAPLQKTAARMNAEV